MKNTSQTPTALGPQLEDPLRAATARAALAVAAVVLEVVAATAVVVPAAVEAHPMALAEELVAAAIAEVEAM
jgi:hypothetical protein